MKSLLGELGGGEVKDQCFGFSMLAILRGPTQRPANINTSTLVFVCALWHKEAYNTGNHVFSANNQKIVQRCAGGRGQYMERDRLLLGSGVS